MPASIPRDPDGTPDVTHASAGDAAEEVTELLHAVNHRIRHASRPGLEPLGLTPALARALRLIGRADAPLRMSELAEHLRIAPRSATSLVDELTGRGLVRRCSDPADRRVVGVAPTTRGIDVLRQVRDRRRAAGAQLVSCLSPTELSQLRDLLRRIDGH